MRRLILVAVLIPFWAHAATKPEYRPGLSDEAVAAADRGFDLFMHSFSNAEGVGPDFNGRSCVFCHFIPRAGGDGFPYRSNLDYGIDLRRHILDDPEHADLLREQIRQMGTPFLLTGPEGPLLHQFRNGALREQIPPEANAMSLRKAAELRGSGLIDKIPDAEILRNQQDQAAAGRVSGRAVVSSSGRVHRFGSQLQFPPTLPSAVAFAFRGELGIDFKELGAAKLGDVVAFLEATAPPPSTPTRRLDQPDALRRGRELMDELGCTDCHRATYRLADGTEIHPYSDFLLHDMGPMLDDGVALGQAQPYEYRTTPLWGEKDRSVRLLHDVRGATHEQTLRWHGGEAAESRRRWMELSDVDHASVLVWLDSLKTPDPVQ